MKDNYENCLALTLKWEGGDVNHPDDPGGKTRWGITQGTYDAWRKDVGLKTRSVFEMERWEMLEIYRSRYWQPVRGNDLPLGVDLVTWDYGVNSGPARAVKALQAAVGVKQDGVVGPVTLFAVRAKSAISVIQNVCARRLAHYKGLSTWKTFGKGWSRRIAEVEAEAVKMAVSKLPAPTQRSILTGEAGKAEAASAVKTGQAVVVGGGGTAAGASIANDQLVASADQFVAWGLLGLFALGIIVAIFLARKARHDQARAKAYARAAAEV